MSRLSVLLLVAVQVSCRTLPDRSETKVINGAPSNDLSVVKIEGEAISYCTGTFIGSNVILTAAHCLPYQMQFAGKHPRWVVARDITVVNNQNELNHDIGLMVFEDDLAPAISPLIKDPWQAGDGVRIVGYGCDSNGPNGKDQLGGTNTVLRLVTNDGVHPFVKLIENMVLVAQEKDFAGPLGENVKTCPGDSGGPLFRGKEIGGVNRGSMSAYLTVEEQAKFSSASVFSNLLEPINLNILRHAVRLGAKIDGVNGQETVDERTKIYDINLWALQQRDLRSLMKDIWQRIVTEKKRLR